MCVSVCSIWCLWVVFVCAHSSVCEWVFFFMCVCLCRLLAGTPVCVCLPGRLISCWNHSSMHWERVHYPSGEKDWTCVYCEETVQQNRTGNTVGNDTIQHICTHHTHEHSRTHKSQRRKTQIIHKHMQVTSKWNREGTNKQRCRKLSLSHLSLSTLKLLLTFTFKHKRTSVVTSGWLVFK